MTPDQIKEKIKQARAQGVPDEVTFKYLNDRGLIPKEKIVTAQQVQPEQNQGFIDKFKTGTVNVVKDIVGLEQNKSDAFVPSLLRSTIGSQGLAGVAQLPGRVAFSLMHPDDPNAITAGQAIGTTANAILTAGTAGSPGVAKNAVTTGLAKYGGSLSLKTLSNVTKVAVPTAIFGENAIIGGAYKASQNLVDKKDIGEGVVTASLISGSIPVVGKGLSKAKSAILSKATPTAELVINSLIKPLQKDFAYGKNPAQGILKEGIVANNLDDLSKKVYEKTNQVGKLIGETGQQIEKTGKLSLDLTPALAPIDEAIQSAAKNNNTTLFQSLQNVKTALVYNLKVGMNEKGIPAIVQGDAKNLLNAGYNDAVNFLDDIAEHTRFTGNPSDDKALNAATRDAYRIVRELMNTGADSVDTKLGTQIRSLNERYGNLLSAKSAINHRDIVLKRQNILNLADKFSVPVAVAGAMMTGFATGDWSKAGLLLASEIGVIAGTKAIGSTASKTRIAKFLASLDPQERIGILNSTPILKNYYERLTGQTTPEDINAPKTKILQTIDDYIKNPKLSDKKLDQKSKGIIDLGNNNK